MHIARIKQQTYVFACIGRSIFLLNFYVNIAEMLFNLLLFVLWSPFRRYPELLDGRDTICKHVLEQVLDSDPAHMVTVC